MPKECRRRDAGAWALRMILVHASLADGRFLLWGESPPAQGAGVAGARRGRKAAKTPRLRWSPFEPTVALAGPIREVLHTAKPLNSDAEQVVLWLPTVADSPIASNPLIAEPPQ